VKTFEDHLRAAVDARDAGDVVMLRVADTLAAATVGAMLATITGDMEDIQITSGEPPIGAIVYDLRGMAA
jgi:hypothetical protein